MDDTVLSLPLSELDSLAPFGLVVDESGAVTNVGPSLARIAPSLLGSMLLDEFDVVRPLGIDAVEGLRAVTQSLVLLHLRCADLAFRFQVVRPAGRGSLLLVGTPVVATSDELERHGLTTTDFSPIDHTPDLLLLRRGQERSLRDLHSLNVELGATARDLRQANHALARAEAQYRRLVELQPLVMYVDRLGASPVGEFVSPAVEAWLGYPAERWLGEPGFFFSIVHPEDRARVWDAHLRSEQSDSPFDLEFRLVTADGRTVWTRAVDSVVRDEDDPRGRRIGFMLDISAAKAADLELRETMSRLTTLLAHLQSGVMVEDVERRVVMVNETMCGIFRTEVAVSDLIGLPASAAVSRIVPATDDPAGLLRRTDDLLARRWPAVADLVELSDGRVLEFDFQPIVDGGRDLGALWMVRDVTSRVQNEAALARARDEAVAASDAKSQFLASMSHEIRTPMHGVLATIELLQTTRLDPEQRELVEVVSGSATALVEIINDILDLQKVESGRIELVEESFCPRELAESVVGLLEPQARSKGLGLLLQVDPDLPALLVGDPLRLRQVLVNLAGNAVKFTSRGSVLVDVRMDPSADRAAVLRVSVRDTGDGIPAARIDEIFDPFVQARRGQEGTGLGLAISERLVRMMGGRLEVSSEVGRGTTFAFELRLREPAVGKHHVPAAGHVDPQPSDRVVLVVDHSTATRGLLMRQLARIGVQARAVGSGSEAVEALGHGAPYGLVLIDVGHPEGGGRSAVDAILAALGHRSPKVPVVGLVAGGSERDRALCLDAGVDDQLEQPVDITELRAVVDRWLHGPSSSSVSAVAT